MTDTRPVAQIQNPFKAPEWEAWGTQIRPQTKVVLDDFCQKYGYSLKDVVDAAILDYIENHERNQ